MRPKLKITGPGTHEQVRDAFRKESDPKRRRKLQAIRLGFMGEHTTEEIAEIVGCAKSSVTAWVKAYREGDIEGLLTTHHKPGREPSLNEIMVAELLQGLEDGRWKRIKEIRKWLSDEHKVVLSYRGVHYWLEKLGASLKVPRKSHAKKDNPLRRFVNFWVVSAVPFHDGHQIQKSLLHRNVGDVCAPHLIHSANVHITQ